MHTDMSLDDIAWHDYDSAGVKLMHYQPLKERLHPRVLVMGEMI